jgi:hypothetical protein
LIRELANGQPLLEREALENAPEILERAVHVRTVLSCMEHNDESPGRRRQHFHLAIGELESFSFSGQDGPHHLAWRTNPD